MAVGSSVQYLERFLALNNLAKIENLAKSFYVLTLKLRELDITGFIQLIVFALIVLYCNVDRDASLLRR